MVGGVETTLDGAVSGRRFKSEGILVLSHEADRIVSAMLAMEKNVVEVRSRGQVLVDDAGGGGGRRSDDMAVH